MSELDETGKPIIRLSRKGTVVAKSSDFTRDAAILHTADVVVGLEGRADAGAQKAQVTAGVGFISAASRLDRIFHKSTESKTRPVPPPPPTPSRLRSDVTKQDNSLEYETRRCQSTLAKSVLTTSSVSSNDSSTAENITQQLNEAVVPPPPLEGLFVRSPTRHSKLIKTKLSDLPAELQQQQPEIRGGVAIYKVTSLSDQERLGKTVEINAIDHILQLREKVNEMERHVSILRGKLKMERRERAIASRQAQPQTSRAKSFLQKNTSQPRADSREVQARRAPRSRTVVNLGKQPWRSNGAGTSDQSTSKLSDSPNRTAITKRCAPPSQSSQNMFSETRSNATVNESAVSASRTLFTNEMRAAPSGWRAQSPAAAVSADALPYQNSRDYVYVVNQTGWNLHDRGHSSADQGLFLADKQTLKRPFAGKPRQIARPILKEEHVSLRHPKLDREDRNASPLTGVEGRKLTRRPRVNRTQSFSTRTSDGLPRGSMVDNGSSDKVSRASSMHRESTARAPPPRPERAQPVARRGLGVRRFLGLR